MPRAPWPCSDHAAFFEAVADELKGKPIGDGSVGCAIRVAQAKFTHPKTAHAPHTSWNRNKNPHGKETPQGPGKINDAA